MVKAIYPGSFDPITLGHLDIIKRSAAIFDELIVAVMVNPDKKSTFTMEERINLIKENVKDLNNVTVVGFSGLLAHYMKTSSIKAIVKGLRTVTDYEYEFGMALVNKRLYNDAETFLMPTSAEYSVISSSMVKSLARFGGSFSEFVPSNVEVALKEKNN